MKVISPYSEILTPIDRIKILSCIEKIGRVCYKSEDKITEDSASKFVKMLIQRGHEAMIEHFSISVKFVCDRGVSHEIVRHRIASYAQESTRYCNYSNDKFGNEITVIEPFGLKPGQYYYWLKSCEMAEDSYLKMLYYGTSPEMARSVLPNSLKTEIVVTMNLREWRHFFKLRTALAAHPQMRELTIPLFEEFCKQLPEIFGENND